jgi:RNA polymerase sigma-32 factor
MVRELIRDSGVDRYTAEISRYPLLTREREKALAERYRNHGDFAAAHQLVVANLRFVVKVAHEYRGYHLNLLDLIQEGNIGLMLAIRKFDPRKGFRLISYAVWWIRAQIHNFIMRSWSLVKLGSGHVRRKLFFKQRPARDSSLDAPVWERESETWLDQLNSPGPSQEDQMLAVEERQLIRGLVSNAMRRLNRRERYIVRKRLMTDEPRTLQQIGRHFQVSREYIRQIERNILRRFRQALINNGDWAPAVAG